MNITSLIVCILSPAALMAPDQEIIAFDLRLYEFILVQTEPIGYVRCELLPVNAVTVAALCNIGLPSPHMQVPSMPLVATVPCRIFSDGLDVAEG